MPGFTVFTIENGAVQEKAAVVASRNGHAALAGFLKNSGVDVVICGGIGDGAKDMLSSAGIRLVSGIAGDAEDAAQRYLAGTLHDMGGGCSHEGHDHAHNDGCGGENHCH